METCFGNFQAWNFPSVTWKRHAAGSAMFTKREMNCILKTRVLLAVPILSRSQSGEHLTPHLILAGPP